MGEPRVSFTPFTLPWAEIPLPLQGITDSKPLNYRMYTIPLPNICHCARLSLSFNKTGGGSAIPTLKSKRLAWYCARLSLSFNKIGGGSAMSNKNKFSFATALAFHYLSIRQEAARQCQIKINFHLPLRSPFTIFAIK